MDRPGGGTRRQDRGVRVTSTRAPAGDPGVSLSQALAAGLAPDGGLYVPRQLPTLGREELEAAADAAGDPDPLRALSGVARVLLTPFFRDDPLGDALPELCTEAFAFPAPLVGMRDRAAAGVKGEGQAGQMDGPQAGRADGPQVGRADGNHAEPEDGGQTGEGGQALLELFHGPTSAFKDYAARFLAAALSRLPAGGERHVLVATSGDTGSAVGAAFHRRRGFRVTILYPEKGVSPRQAHLLGCFGDNVQALRVRGSFDDCQRLVKATLIDPGLRARHGLTSANSISLGRLLPQMAYHAHAALRSTAGALAGPPAMAPAEGSRPSPPGFIIPSGNFGNALACIWAREMGLPIGHIILATNENRALVDWLETGTVSPRPVRRTLANAMDVAVPSNLERLRSRYPDPHGPQRSGEGNELSDQEIRHSISAVSVSDPEIRRTLADAPSRWDRVVCPHTACGMHVLGELRRQGDRRAWIAVATAHPAKFPEVVEPSVGHSLEPPPAMRAWLEHPARAEPLEPDPQALARALG
jgi:threonine synthase